jgi:hypothetical protein
MWLEFARPLALPLLAIALGALWLRPERPHFLLPLAIVALHSLYSIYVGGDVYDYFAAANRFVAPFVPLLFVLANGLANEALARMPDRWRPTDRARRYVLVGAFGALLLASNGLLELQARKQWLTYLAIERPLFVDKHPELVARALRLTELLAPDALVSVSWAGIPPFFADRFRWVDFLGYNERRIAHAPATQRAIVLDDYEHFDPGHMKWDIPYIVNEVRPDAIYLNGSMQNPIAVAAHDYELVEGLYWLRRDSDKRIR